MTEEHSIRILGDLQHLTLGPDDMLILRCKDRIDVDTAERIKHTFEKYLNGRKCPVIDSVFEAATMGPDRRLDSIEAKLDKLLRALADDADEPPARTLDGDVVGEERDGGQSLG